MNIFYIFTVVMGISHTQILIWLLSGVIAACWQVYGGVSPALNEGIRLSIPVMWKYAKFQTIGLLLALLALLCFLSFLLFV